ncbi:permease [Paenibacillus tarimensis]
MIPGSHPVIQNRKSVLKALVPVLVFLLLAVSGLFYVKWWPYYHKALFAAEQHTIGGSILNVENTLASLSAASQYAISYFKSVWKAAVLGILLGSLVQAVLPADWLYRLFGKPDLKSTFLGGAVALPGMMCSCCAAPIAAGLRERKASVGASLAFWLGNPVLNPAVLIFMTFVLSWKFTILRLVFGVILTFGVSYLANRFAKHETAADEVPLPHTESGETASIFVRWMKSAAAITIHAVPAYVISVFVLSAIHSFMFPVWLEAGILAVIVFAVIGALFVIPTAAEIPIIQSFLSFGMGTGPAAALLVTLPALSLPSILLVYKSFPRKVIWFVFASVVGIGILSGLIGSFVL